MEILRALYSVLGIFFRARPEGWVFILGLIVPTALHALWRVHQIHRLLAAEKEALDVVRHLLAGTVAQPRLILDADVASWRSHTPPGGLVDRLLQTLWATRAMPNPDLEAVATMLGQSEAARLSSVRGAPNRLMLAGLLGTVAGLAGVVGTLGPQIQGALLIEDPRALTGNLVNTLRHMQDAFACTAWGISLAILVGGLINRVASKQSSMLADAQQFGLEHFAPRVFPASQAAQFEDVRRILQESKAFLSDVSGTMSNVSGIMTSAATQFNAVLTQAGTAMSVSVQRLERVATNMESALLKVAQDVRDSAVQLDRSAKSLHEYHNDLRNAYVTLMDLFKQSQSQLEEQARDQLQKIGELQGQFASTSSSIVSKMDTIGTDLSTTARAFESMGARFYQSGTEVQIKLDSGFQGIGESVKSTLDSHRSEMGHVEETLRLINSQLQDLSQRLDPRMLPVGEWANVRDAIILCAQELHRIQNEHADLQRVIRLLEQLVTLQSSSPPPGSYPATLPVSSRPVFRGSGNLLDSGCVIPSECPAGVWASRWCYVRRSHNRSGPTGRPTAADRRVRASTRHSGHH